MATTLAKPQHKTSQPAVRPDAPKSGQQVTGENVPFAEIQEEAYSLFLARGGEHGHDLEDWLAAEALVRNRGHHQPTHRES